MNPRVRLALLALAFIVLAPAAAFVILGMPPLGEPLSLYGSTVNALAPKLRHVSNMVAAVNYDIRGIDTLGEESMLLCAVTGAVMLLRGRRGEDMSERAGRVPGRAIVRRSDATVLLCRFFATVLFLFGVNMILHGTVTPGGGFQGGVVAASSLMLLYLGEGYTPWRRIVRSPLMAALEGGGALAFVLCAALPLGWGHAALQNTLPLGTFRNLFSGGLMLVVNDVVGVAVFGSFGALLLEFMEETRSPQDDSMPDEEDV
ncbi:MAG TPA: MnhB domain-containing protein [Rhodanobacteraceae bacterium]